MKIKNKINLTFSLLFFIIIFIFGLTINIIGSQSLENQSYEDIKVINNARAANVRSFLNSEKEVIGILTASTIFRDFLKQTTDSNQYLREKERTLQRLNRSIQEVSQIYELFILDNQGKIVISTDKTKEGLIRDHDAYFINAQNNIFIKDLYYSETSNQLSYSVSGPIKDDLTGETLGVIVARMNPENLFKATNLNNNWGKSGENFLVNSSKLLISPTRFLGLESILRKKIDTQNVSDCFNPKELVLLKDSDYSNDSEILTNYIDYRGQHIIGTHSYIPEANWCLITKIDQTEVLAPNQKLISYLIILSLLLLIIFLFLGLVISKKITKPLDELREGIKTLEKGNFDNKVKIASKDEIGELAKYFNQMVAIIKASRTEIDQKIKEQTSEIAKNSLNLEKQKRAILNVLDDVRQEKAKTDNLANIVMNSEEAIISKSLDGTILTWNHGAEKLYGYSAAEAIGQSIKIIIPKERLTECDHIIETINKNGQINHYQTVRQKKGGDLVDVSLSISPIKDHENKIVQISSMSFDITKEKQIDRAKTEFVSLASHQLRTPLSSINWYAEMLLAGDAGKLTDEQQNFIKEIYAGNQRMVELVNSLLNVSRLELGTFAVDPEPTNLVQSAESVLKELQPGIEAKKMKISFAYDKKLPLLEADPKLIRIIFQNLLSNSIKYTPEKGQIKLAINKDEKNILIKVTDNGYGIPKKQKDKIFEKLFRADNVKEKDTEGTGLGLYILKSIVDQSNGKIWFESEENKGTTFFIELPLSGMKKKSGAKPLE